MLRNKDIHDRLKDLDLFLLDQYKAKHGEKKTNWRTYEQEYAIRIKTAMTELEPLIDEAVSTIPAASGPGRPHELTLKQRVLLLLLQRLFGESNRMMASMLMIFSVLTGIDVSYKTVERLYSDEEVDLALYNLHILILKKKGVKDVDACGDGTGYSLTVSRHYASTAQKEKDAAKENSEGDKTAKSESGKKAKKRRPIFSANGISTVKKIFSEKFMRFETTVFEELVKMSDGEIEIKDVKNKRYIVKKTGDYFEIYSVKKGFIYSFKIQDTVSQMYIAGGISRISEKRAFDSSLEMKEEMKKDIEITLRSVSLDRYYSYSSYVDRFDENTTVYVIPKKNSTLNGSWKWKNTVGSFVNDTMSYLEHHYQREHSENGWSVDKRRFGWSIPQRRDDRIDTSDFCTLLLHNLLRLGAT